MHYFYVSTYSEYLAYRRPVAWACVVPRELLPTIEAAITVGPYSSSSDMFLNSYQHCSFLCIQLVSWCLLWPTGDSHNPHGRGRWQARLGVDLHPRKSPLFTLSLPKSD